MDLFNITPIVPAIWCYGRPFPIQFRQDEYWCAGDNSRESFDSMAIYGSINENQINGVVYKIIWPLSRVKRFIVMHGWN